MAAHYDQGDHAATITKQEFGQSDNANQTPFFALTIQPTAKIDMETSDREDVIGPVRTLRLFLSDKAAPHTIKKLRALGWDGSSFGELNPDADDHHSFVGQEIVVRCKHEEYNGQPQEKWDFPQEGGLEIKKLDDKGMRKLDALFGKHLKEGAKPKSSAPKQATTTTAAAGNSSKVKVPF